MSQAERQGKAWKHREMRGVLYFMLLESVVFFYFHLSATLLEGLTLYVAFLVGSYCQAVCHDITSF